MSGVGEAPPIRVAVVDDHRLMREGLLQLLHDAAEVEPVASADSAAAALRDWRSWAVDAILVDLALGEDQPNGLALTQALLEAGFAGRILLLTMFAEPRLQTEARAAGAAGYLLKDESAAAIARAIRDSVGGAEFVTSPGAPVVADESDSGQALSPREREVLTRIARGEPVKMVADKLELSQHTVDTYRRRLARKLNARNQAELVRAAVRLGLVQDS